MTDSEGEIEFLDEDAIIVQHCMQSNIGESDEIEYLDSQENSLLVERPPKPKPKRRRQKEEIDEDYNPKHSSEGPSKKRKTHKNENVNTTLSNLSKKELTIKKLSKEPAGKHRPDIIIPDYKDPAALNVDIIESENNKRVLKKWNELCLSQMEKYSTRLECEKDEIQSSKKVVVFHNLKNRSTGKLETTLWSKTTFNSSKNTTETESFNGVFPKFQYNNNLEYKLSETKQFNKKSKVPSITSVLLAKESHKDVPALVVYNQNQSTVAVYNIEETRTENENQVEVQRNLSERAYCNICAPCFQYSWRDTTGADSKKKICSMCNKSFVNNYNLLAHIKTHGNSEVRKNKKYISNSLAEILNYHYKCRICSKHLPSIKSLRLHISNHHKSNTPFRCEVCHRNIR